MNIAFNASASSSSYSTTCNAAYGSHVSDLMDVRGSKLINDIDDCEWMLYSARACPNRIFERSSGLRSIACLV